MLEAELEVGVPAAPVPGEPAEVSADAVSAEIAAGGPPADQVATATLGELYLEQEHFEEAAEIFRDVLRRQPDNTAAMGGLRRAEAAVQSQQPSAATVTAPQLLGKYAGDSVLPEGLTAKKILVLDSYLKHLRGGQHHVR